MRLSELAKFSISRPWASQYSPSGAPSTPWAAATRSNKSAEIVGKSEDRFSKGGHEAQFEGRSRIGVDPAKRREIENPRIRLAYQRDIGGEDFLVRRLARRGRKVMIERIKPDKAEFLA